MNMKMFVIIDDVCVLWLKWTGGRGKRGRRRRGREEGFKKQRIVSGTSRAYSTRGG